MRQEELLQSIFLFIFVFLIIIFVGSSISRFSLADANDITTRSSISVINITGSTNTAEVWLNQGFLVTIIGSNINKIISLKFTDPNNAVIERQIDCVNSSQGFCSSTALASLVGKSGTWTVAAYIDSVELIRKEFTVKSLCGVASGEAFNVTKVGTNWCQDTADAHNLNLCTSPASAINAFPLTSTSKCTWNCSTDNITESCYFNYIDNDSSAVAGTANYGSSIVNACVSLSPVYTLESSSNLCVGGTVTSFVSNNNGWTWKCVSGGNSLNCSANKKINGTCGVVTESSTMPTANLCVTGTAGNVSGVGPWTWTCSGINGGANITCSANKKSIASIVLDGSKIIINPSSAVIGSSVSVRVEVDSSLLSAESLNLVSKPILSSLNNQLSVVLKKCISGNAFCGTFSAPDIAGEWSVLLYSSDGTKIQISTLKTFVVVSNDQMPIIGVPLITPSVVNPGDSIVVKLSVQNSVSVKSIKISLRSQDGSFALLSTIDSVCSDDASSWCTKIIIPNGYSGGVLNLSVISYVNSSGSEKIISSSLKSSFTIKTACSYKYSDWSKCIDKKQTRTVIEKSPSDCIVNSEELTRSCVPCIYSYSNWSSCQDGKRYRTVLSGFSEGCSEGEKIVEEKCQTVNCLAYVYSDWSLCQNGKRTRKLISASPSGCFGNSVLEEACVVSQSSCSEDKWQCEPWGACTKDNNQSRKCSIIFDCPTVKHSTPELTKFCNFLSINPEQNVDVPL
ncbi:hypothetical protein M0Q03_02540, partial [bacterium]|nr:hypothetical protein [bacterium]